MITGSFGVYILSIVGAVVLTSVADIIMPEGKTSKYVKNALSIFLVLIIISPISQMLSGGVNFDNFFETDNIQTDYSFILKLNEQKAEALEQNTKSHLKQAGYENITVNILYTGNTEGIKVDYVHLDLTKFEFNANDEHIHIIDNIIKCVSVFLNISKEKIYTYGTN